MAGRHRRPRPRPDTRRLTIAAAGTVGAATLVLPLAPGAAFADTQGAAPKLPSPPDLPGQHQSHQSRGDRVVQAASEEYGHPYMWGAEGPVAFDCSGLTKYVYKQFGVQLPHNSAAQYDAVRHVSKSDMRRGDLVFIYDEGGIFHVGIYAGGDQMWAATHTGDIVRKQEIWTDRYVVGRP